MYFTYYSDVKNFYKDTYDVLMRHEAQNVIPLGNIIIGNKGQDKAGWRDPANWFMATVSDSNCILLTAVMTPPKNLTLYATDNSNNEATLHCLMDGIAEKGISIPGVMAEKALTEMFAKAYAAKHGIHFKIDTDQRIYELSQINPTIPKTGTARLYKKSDMAFLPYWIAGFDHECFGDNYSIRTNKEPYNHRISANNLFVLEDNGVPVTMAKISRELQTVCVIGLVYTPPYFRGKGYATACVAAVSQIALDRGFSKCVLYTDLANPISNSIYMKIGYEPICDSLDIKFTRK